MKKGTITVFLSLLLSSLLSLVGAVIISARYSTARARTETVTDLALTSVFAEYNRELLKQYDLYFIDTSYGSGNPSLTKLQEHLKSYLQLNFQPAKHLAVFGAADMTGLSLSRADISLFSAATDQGGRVLKRQAIHSLKDRFGISLAEELKQNIRDYDRSGIRDERVDEKRARVEAKLKGKDLDESLKPVSSVMDKRPGILNLILAKEMVRSDKELPLKDLSSRGKKLQGIGLVRAEEDPDSPGNELLFNEYLSWKLSCYTRDLKHRSCSYELEYVLNGKNTDLANLRETVKKLLLMREASDTMAVFRDAGKKAQADAAGTVAALLLLSPELKEPLSDLILFTWGFAEAVLDVRTLLKGGKIPLVKESGDWQLKRISQLPSFLTRAVKKDGRGLDYRAYLKLLLALENPSGKLARAMDVIEMNLRTTEGNSAFCLGGCLDYLEADIEVTSSYGFGFSIRRDYAYEPVIE